MSTAERRVLVALRAGPLYRPTLEVILGVTEARSRVLLRALMQKGLVELAADIGPATYRLTGAGVREAL